MLERIFKKKKPEDIFWNWFSKKADLYFHFERNRDVLFSKLKAELEKIHPDLTFEFSPVFEDGTRELVISADGIKSIFPIVIKLVKQAPILQKWKIIAFRQPHKEVTQINYQDLTINLKDVFFRYSKDKGQVGLELNIRGFYESPEWTAGIFILLDNVIGEYHTEMSLSHIYKKQLDETEVNNLFPIENLPQIIQDYHLELNN
ncbi:hypothetical protein QF042_003417 [Pedobacter sp. W3I1]|uniref:hypothetical protein n=1 Tax=Pedobacter sp. W3I1 TaxID=3042291 RepID=UPI00278B0B9A|nr:hypothetical protein [Pedobacter sp. W3I1]MDQ0639852.1 hypothetical protein [Pedobacter sp. W3I1]